LHPELVSGFQVSGFPLPPDSSRPRRAHGKKSWVTRFVTVDSKHPAGIHSSFNTTRIDISLEHVDAIDKPHGRVDIITIFRLVWTLAVGHTQLTTSNIEESEDDLRSINAV
jgi:hypothetical protein